MLPRGLSLSINNIHVAAAAPSFSCGSSSAHTHTQSHRPLFDFKSFTRMASSGRKQKQDGKAKKHTTQQTIDRKPHAANRTLAGPSGLVPSGGKAVKVKTPAVRPAGNKSIRNGHGSVRFGPGALPADGRWASPARLLRPFVCFRRRSTLCLPRADTPKRKEQFYAPSSFGCSSY